MELLIDYLDRLLQAQAGTIVLPPDCELVVQVTFDGSEAEKRVLWQYYYVDPQTRSLFWLRPFDVGGDLEEVYGDVSPAHFSEFPTSRIAIVLSYHAYRTPP